MSFRRCLLLVMLAVAVVAQLVAAGATLRTLQQDTLARGERQLGVGLDVTYQLLDGRGRQLRDNVAILASDFGFKGAVATQDTDTLISVLANHGDRANADMVLLGDPEGRLLASSHHPPDIALPFPELWQQAREVGEAVEVVMHEGRPYQFVLMPVRAPGLIGWVGMGFLLDAELADEIGALTRLETRFVALPFSPRWKRRSATSATAPASTTARPWIAPTSTWASPTPTSTPWSSTCSRR